MNKLRDLACFFLLIISPIIASHGEYKFEGYFNHLDKSRLRLISLFLPYNPTIVAYGQTFQIAEQCAKQWHYGVFSNGNTLAYSNPCDFLWIDDERDPLQILARYCNHQELKVIYASTSFKSGKNHYKNLKDYLERHGFTLLSHWYWDGQNGNAIFLKKSLFDTAMRSWNYSPGGNIHTVPVNTPEGIERFFKRAEGKGNHNNYEGIDFIYMINLDERPEKFALASEGLHQYGIFPYRFSAVNGWKLPLQVIQQVGVPFSPSMTDEQLLGSIFKEVEGKECVSNELIQKEGEMYLSLGMTRGAIGIVLSHLSVLQDAYDSGYETIWVMEDDVEAIRNPAQIPQLILQLDQFDKEWDILFTDPDTQDSQGNYVACRSLAARPNFGIQPLSYFLNYFYPVDQDLSRIGMRYGAYSMILRRSGIEKILEYFKTYHIFLAYDMDFWLIPNLRMYGPNKAIISHRSGSPTDNSMPNYTQGQ